jgi:hypothetical protein
LGLLGGSSPGRQRSLRLGSQFQAIPYQRVKLAVSKVAVGLIVGQDAGVVGGRHEFSKFAGEAAADGEGGH